MQDRLLQLVAQYVDGSRDITVLLVSPDRGVADRLRALPGVRLESIHEATRADDLDIGRQAELGIVTRQLESMSAPHDVNLLCRLRDCNCSRILLELRGERPTAQELLAIGFYRDSSVDSEARMFRYDRDEFFEPRQWNSPEDWAHPENFHKRRW